MGKPSRFMVRAWELCPALKPTPPVVANLPPAANDEPPAKPKRHGGPGRKPIYTYYHPKVKAARERVLQGMRQCRVCDAVEITDKLYSRWRKKGFFLSEQDYLERYGELPQ